MIAHDETIPPRLGHCWSNRNSDCLKARDKFARLVFFFVPAAENSDDVLKDHVLKGQYVSSVADARLPKWPEVGINGTGRSCAWGQTKALAATANPRSRWAWALLIYINVARKFRTE
jgi:hypothetical protein